MNSHLLSLSQAITYCLSIIFLFNSCKDDPPEPKGSIQGKVTVVDTQIPIEGIVINLSGTRSASQATRSTGAFEIKELPVGDYTLTISESPSYRSVAPIQTSVRGNSATRADFSMTPKGSISGKVLIEGSTNRISGALVELKDSPPANYAESRTTGSDGIFQFEGLLDGKFIVTVSHPLYETTDREFAVLNGREVNADFSLPLSDPAIAPVASFDPSPKECDAPCTVEMNDDSEGDIDKYFWNFGDGDTSNLSNPSHLYKNPGNYVIELTLMGPGGTVRASTSVQINSKPLSTFIQSSIGGGEYTSLVQRSDGKYLIFAGYGPDDPSAMYLIDEEGQPANGYPKSYFNFGPVGFGNSMVANASGGFTLVGYSLLLGDTGTGLISTDFNGNETKGLVILDNPLIVSSRGLGITLTTSGHTAVTGVADPNYGALNSSVFLTIVDQEGRNISGFPKIFEGDEIGSDTGHDIIETQNGGFAIIGHNRNRTDEKDDEFVLILTDNQGNLTNESPISFSTGIYDFASNLTPRSLIQTSSKNFAIVGEIKREVLGYPNVELILVLTDSKGKELSNSPRRFNLGNGARGASLVETRDGGFAIAGTMLDGTTDKPFLIFTDSNGNEKVGSPIVFDFPGVSSEIIQTSDGGFAIVGSKPSIFLIKTDAEGNVNK